MGLASFEFLLEPSSNPAVRYGSKKLCCSNHGLRRLVSVLVVAWKQSDGNSGDGSNGEGDAHEELGRTKVLHEPEEEVVEEAPQEAGNEKDEEEGWDVHGAEHL